MSFWNGTRWIEDKQSAPRKDSSRASRWSATILMLFGLAAVAVPLTLVSAGQAPGCALSSVVLGGTPVVQVDGWDMRHNATYVIRWVEPTITQTQYWWSTSKGMLQQTVLNNQGTGVFSASLYYLGPRGETWETSCSMTV